MAAMGQYAIEAILSHRLNKDTLITEFRVKWVGYKETNWEPLDNVYDSPKLIEGMQVKKFAEYSKSVKGLAVDPEVLSAAERFPVLDKTITAKFKDPIEFVPSGSEKLHWIISEMLSEKETLLWKVLFKHNLSAPFFVRKAVVSYYWPLEASLFLGLWVKKNERRTARLRAVEEKETV